MYNNNFFGKFWLVLVNVARVGSWSPTVSQRESLILKNALIFLGFTNIQKKFQGFFLASATGLVFLGSTPISACFFGLDNKSFTDAIVESDYFAACTNFPCTLFPVKLFDSHVRFPF
jgi:hypothetical protein